MPAHRKHPDARQDRRASRMLAVVTHDDPGRPVPDPPPGLLAQTVERWQAFWRSRMSTALDLESDLPGIIRWAIAYDEWLRATLALRKVRIVPGSMGQPVLSPLAGYVSQRAAELRDLERAYGMTPKSRLDLGLTFSQVELTVAKLNEMGADAVDDDPADDLGDLEAEWEPA